MNKPVFHPATELQLQKFLLRPGHAVIIFGPEGIGKHAASIWLSLRLLGFDDTVSLEKYPYVTTVQPDGTSISIQAMRELANFTKLKIPAKHGEIKRIAIIDQAQLLTTEAQNALLKLLEEPPEDTLIILTATSELSLLATVRSRSQKIQIQTPPGNLLSEHFKKLDYPESKINQALLMSGGLPGLMLALLDQKEDHPLAKAAGSARELLKADSFQRQCMVDGLSKQRIELIRLLFMLKQMSHAAIAQNADRQSGMHISRWQRIEAASYEAESALQMNAQPKLVLANFMLQI